jgi:transposase
VRATTLLNRLVVIDGAQVTGVTTSDEVLEVTIALRRRRLVCPHCGYTTNARYDRRTVHSRWRHLDVGVWRCMLRVPLRRLRCPGHGVVTEAVPFARHRSGFTRDFEDLVAWLATRMDKTALGRLLRIAWRTVGAIVERVVADDLDPHRLDGLTTIGVDEVSWRKHHHYLSLVVDHDTGHVVWGAEGKDAETLDQFFAELGEERSAALQAVSMDMGPAFKKSVQANAPQAAICTDPFHVVALGTKALDEVRRSIWQELRRLDEAMAKRFKGARWALLKNPEDLTDRQAGALAGIKRTGAADWRAYLLKEALRAVFDRDLDATSATELLDRWCAWAQRSRLDPFIKLARTIRRERPGIVAALELRITNGRTEGLNNRVRLIVRRAFGFHSAKAALALVMLSCGPIKLVLPHERTEVRPHSGQ